MIVTRFDQSEYLEDSGKYTLIRELETTKLMSILANYYKYPSEIITNMVYDIENQLFSSFMINAEERVRESIHEVTSLTLDQVMKYFSVCKFTQAITKELEERGVNNVGYLNLLLKEETRWLELMENLKQTNLDKE